LPRLDLRVERDVLDVASLLHRGTLAGPLATLLIGRKPLITFVTC
jgi:hypothetical protein